jgi:hypothetical protein
MFVECREHSVKRNVRRGQEEQTGGEDEKQIKENDEQTKERKRCKEAGATGRNTTENTGKIGKRRRKDQKYKSARKERNLRKDVSR